MIAVDDGFCLSALRSNVQGREGVMYVTNGELIRLLRTECEMSIRPLAEEE